MGWLALLFVMADEGAHLHRPRTAIAQVISPQRTPLHHKREADEAHQEQDDWL